MSFLIELWLVFTIRVKKKHASNYGYCRKMFQFHDSSQNFMWFESKSVVIGITNISDSNQIVSGKIVISIWCLIWVSIMLDSNQASEKYCFKFSNLWFKIHSTHWPGLVVQDKYGSKTNLLNVRITQGTHLVE